MTRDEVIKKAKAMWKKGCEDEYKLKGDWGSCVLGAGIIPSDLTEKQWDHGWVDSKLYIISSHEVTNAQGSCVWEANVKEVVQFMNDNGVKCEYHPGRLD